MIEKPMSSVRFSLGTLWARAVNLAYVKEKISLPKILVLLQVYSLKQKYV
jgi:hypothetical protein